MVSEGTAPTTAVETLAKIPNYGEGNDSALGFSVCRQRAMPRVLRKTTVEE